MIGNAQDEPSKISAWRAGRCRGRHDRRHRPLSLRGSPSGGIPGYRARIRPI